MTDQNDSRYAAQTETVGMAKAGVESAQLATAVWADLLSLTHSKMDKLNADEFDIQIDITVREAAGVTDNELQMEFIEKAEDADEGDVMLFDEAGGNVENLSDGDCDE